MPLFRFYAKLTKKYSSLFTFRSESLVFIGIPGGEEYSGTLHLLFTTLHLSVSTDLRIFLRLDASCLGEEWWRVGEESLITLHPLKRPVYGRFRALGEEWRVSDGIGLSPDCRYVVGAFRSIMLAGFDFYCFSSVLSCWIVCFCLEVTIFYCNFVRV